MIENNDKLRGAKNALLSSILYYYRALELNNCDDIRREIATDVSLALKLSKDQTEFIADTEINSVSSTIDDILILLKTLECNDKHTKNLITVTLNDLKKKIVKI